MSRRSSRRTFLKQTTALSAAWWVGSSAVLAEDSKNPLERLSIACIGVDGKGASDTDDAGRNGNIVALCDIDENRLEKKAGRYPDAQKFVDYREMFDKIGDKIDAVTVSTPDHSHAAAAMMAIKRGKHAFVQKPLTWSVSEARALREAAAKHKVATQMGNQGTSSTKLREAVELVRAGAIGDVKEVHVWTNRPVWPQGTGRPATSDEVPKEIHWDLWLGPAPVRPYHRGTGQGTYHAFNWRGWVDFGTGALGDMACHTMNMPVMALELFDAHTIEADSPGIFEGETYPKFCTIKYDFGSRGKLPPCTMYWYDGAKKPPESLMLGEAPLPNTGSILVGTKGTLVSRGDYGGEENILLPKKDFADFKAPEPTLPRSKGHFEEFATACRGGAPAMSNFNYAGRLTETLLMGNVAIRAGKPIEWDAKAFKVTNLPEANKFLAREYREGWTL
jgi:predicted dehydrogenase